MIPIEVLCLVTLTVIGGLFLVIGWTFCGFFMLVMTFVLGMTIKEK